jgi:hypothetical protein
LENQVYKLSVATGNAKVERRGNPRAFQRDASPLAGKITGVILHDILFSKASFMRDCPTDEFIKNECGV